jgi:hypothetical protein
VPYLLKRDLREKRIEYAQAMLPFLNAAERDARRLSWFEGQSAKMQQKFLEIATMSNDWSWTKASKRPGQNDVDYVSLRPAEEIPENDANIQFG